MSNSQNVKPKIPKVKIAVPAELQGTDCFECVKRGYTDSDEGLYCQVFHHFYFLDPKFRKGDHCYAMETDPYKWANLLRDMMEDTKAKGNHKMAKKYQTELHSVEAYIRSQQGPPGSYAGLGVVYHQEVHKPGVQGRGEKADRTNKMFGPSRMKDNRFKESFTIEDI